MRLKASGDEWSAIDERMQFGFKREAFDYFFRDQQERRDTEHTEYRIAPRFSTKPFRVHVEPFPAPRRQFIARVGGSVYATAITE
jgi:hypothetical protein